MYGYHVVAIFESDAAAEKARSQLLRAGVAADHIHLSHDNDRSSLEPEHHGFFDWLFSNDEARHDRKWYEEKLGHDRSAISVLVPDDHDHLWVAEQLVAAGALDIEDDADSSVTATSIRGRSTKSTASAMTSSASGRKSTLNDDEEVIPVMNEELAVGKRATENRYRVRAHVVERPVEESVNLRDERVIVERRPVSGNRAVSSNAHNWEDREYEVIETHEEPVVEKRSRAVEEVVVRKDVRNRTEKVKDTVRETRIEVDGKDVESRDTTTRRPGRV